jgi:pimeloyl-ACP methyl ester carboxylesterase
LQHRSDIGLSAASSDPAGAPTRDNGVGGAAKLKHFSSVGVEIAFIDVAPQGGDLGEPILLAHGFASNHRINWVNPRWVETLTQAGRRVVAFDNRGHGASEKPTAPEDYRADLMTRDAANLLAHLGIERADVMGYSMGARIASFLALSEPTLVRSLVLGGLGDRLTRDAGLPETIAEALEAPSLDLLADPTQRLFRSFAEQTKSDLAALAACARGFRRRLTPEEAARIAQPTLIAVGERDALAGDLSKLVALLPRAEALSIPGRDHNLAVGDKTFKAGALDFLARRP